MRRVFSFDIDGVVADTGYVSIIDRTVESYKSCKLIDYNIPRFINWLAHSADIYFISARGYQCATDTTRQWMDAQGINMENIAGTITNVKPADKHKLVDTLHATYHFDDDPRIVESLGTRGVLVEILNPWTIEPKPYVSKVVKSWQEISDLCWSVPKLHMSYTTQQTSLEFD